MNKLFSIILLIGLLIYPVSISKAQGKRGPLHNYRKLPTALIALTTCASTRSFTLSDIQGWGLLILYIDHSAHSTLTKVVMTCTASNDASTTDFEIQGCTMSNGDCYSYDGSWIKGDPVAISGVKRWPWRIDTMGFENVSCSFVFTNGSANDAWTVEAAQMTQ